jgi:4-hydroxybenzoate polyprenyltransferase
VKEALAVGAGLSLCALVLVLTTRWEAVAWSVPAALVTILYPYAKRHVAMPQAVLGVAFGFGIPIAFAAAQGQVPLLAWGLFLGNLCWVLAYDTEYAMVDRDDDLKIGIKTSAITLGRFDVAGVMGFYLLFLALWGGLLWPTLGGWPLGLALLLALVQVGWHFSMIHTRSREGCFRAFRLNHWLGATLFLGVLLAGYWHAA